MKFKTYLAEIMKPANVDFNDYRKSTPDLMIYDFVVKDHKFTAVFERDTSASDSIWNFDFTFNDGKSSHSDQRFLDGSEFTVFSYAFGYLFEFIKHMKPAQVLFNGNGTSRISLYKKFLIRALSTLQSNGYGFRIIEINSNDCNFSIEQLDKLDVNDVSVYV